MIYPPVLRNIFKFKRAFVLVILTILLVNGLSFYLDKVVIKSTKGVKPTKVDGDAGAKLVEEKKTQLPIKKELSLEEQEWRKAEETRRILLENFLLVNR